MSATERPGEQLRAKLRTRQQVIDQPPAEPLVDGLLWRQTLALLYAKKGCYKSFLALAWALSVASGCKWENRTTAQGPVIYVAAEGSDGLGRRLQAWETSYGHGATVHDRDDFHVLPGRIRLLQPNDVAALVDVAALLRPALVVIDTLNRCMVGGSEVDDRDMGRVVDALDQVRQAGATVLVLHHARRSDGEYRGHSSLEGAMDTVLKLERRGRGATLHSDAQKDTAEADPITLRTENVALKNGNSLILYCQEGVGSNELEPSPPELELLALLGSTFGSTGASASQLLKVSGMAERTFYRALKGLVDRKLIRNLGSDTRTRYVPIPPNEQTTLP